MGEGEEGDGLVSVRRERSSRRLQRRASGGDIINNYDRLVGWQSSGDCKRVSHIIEALVTRKFGLWFGMSGPREDVGCKLMRQAPVSVRHNLCYLIVATGQSAAAGQGDGYQDMRPLLVL